MYNSVIFSKFAESSNRHHSPRTFRHPQELPVSRLSPPLLPHASSLATTGCFLNLWVCFLDILCTWNCALCDRLHPASFTQRDVSEVRGRCCIAASYPRRGLSGACYPFSAERPLHHFQFGLLSNAAVIHHVFLFITCKWSKNISFPQQTTFQNLLKIYI